MVQQAAPPRTLQTLQGYMAGLICTPGETKCVQIQTMLHLRLDADGTCVLALHHPNDPMRGFQMVGDDDGSLEYYTELLAKLADMVDVTKP